LATAGWVDELFLLNSVGDHASFAPRAVTGGNVTVGEGTAVGIGAVVRHGVTIGEWTMLGAGAVVLEEVPALVSAWGLPCRVVRPRVRGERYLQLLVELIAAHRPDPGRHRAPRPAR
jgi:acetyltransferase-like isoleucine patch superfamily enzyme